MSEKIPIKLVPLALLGLALGGFEYYVKPLPRDMLAWIGKKVFTGLEMPSQEALDDYITNTIGEWHEETN